MRELEGRVAIVTGAARNIGRAIALALADGGASVAIVARSDLDAARAVAGEIESKGARAIPIIADITDAAAVRHMVAETVQHFGALDILVNNAGIRPETPFEAMPIEEWDQVLAVTLDGAFLCSQAAFEHLVKSDAAAIVNIGGLTAYTGAMHRVHVVTAKAGLDGLTKALAVELAPRGVTVNCVSPGLIETVRGKHSTTLPEHHKSRLNLAGRRGRPEEVAAMVRHLAGPNGRYVTGQTIHVNGGAYLA
jgi:3-oxoacyl-[acyl-carrier protein] reductase